MKVRFANAARQDIRVIYLQGEGLFGSRQADAYAAGLGAAFRMIADYPLSSRLRDETASPVRARPYRSHVILYTVDEAGVLILRIRHGLEDWMDDPLGDRPNVSKP